MLTRIASSLKACAPTLKHWAQALKREIIALHMSVRDPRTPLLAKLVAAVVVAYALSPIDLIPDFIPVLGQLDDLILVPLGLWIAVRLVPSHVIAEARARARSGERLPVSRAAGFAIASIWAAALAGAAWMLLRAY